MDIFSFRWLRCAPLLTLPVWLGCEVGETVTRPTCEDLAQGLGGMAGNAPAPGAGSGGTVYGTTVDGVFTPTPLVMTPLVQEALPEDPGPRCLDCTQGRGIEHLVVADFEDGYAPAWFSFDELLHAREPKAIPQGQPNEPPYWGLHVADLATSPAKTRCGSAYALRLQGGPYSQWGGGAGTSYFRLKGAQADQYCPQHIRDIGATPAELPADECGFLLSPSYTGSLAPLHTLEKNPYGRALAGFDASQFDGVAFWARRAPGAQTSLEISIEDFNTSDTAARTAQIELLPDGTAPVDKLLGGRVPACTRAKECCPNTSKDTGQRPRCNEVTVQYGGAVNPYGYTSADYPTQRPVQEFRCYVPDLDNPSGADLPVRVAKVDAPAAGVDDTAYQTWLAWDRWQQDHPLCCPTDFDDPQFGKSPLLESLPARERQKACVTYVVEGNFSNAGTQYCWDPGDPPIPAADENRCGEGFRFTVNLSTEWKLFKIPWSELRRFTLGKPPIDTSSIWAVAFYWRQGYLDTYIDDLGFYKEQP